MANLLIISLTFLISSLGSCFLICPQRKLWIFWGFTKYFSAKFVVHNFSNSLLRKELSITSFCWYFRIKEERDFLVEINCFTVFLIASFSSFFVFHNWNRRKWGASNLGVIPDLENFLLLACSAYSLVLLPLNNMRVRSSNRTNSLFY